MKSQTKKKMIQVQSVFPYIVFIIGCFVCHSPVFAQNGIQINPSKIYFTGTKSFYSIDPVSRLQKRKMVYQNGAFCGISPSPEWTVLYQPTGESFEARMRGSIYQNWLETRNGEPAGFNKETGFYEYLVQNMQGKYDFSGRRVGIDLPPARKLFAGIKTSAHLSSSNIEKRKTLFAPVRTNQPRAFASSEGIWKQLVILVNFSNTSPYYSQNDFHELFNGKNYHLFGSQGSVKEYFEEVSHGKLKVFSTVTTWITLPYPKSYYGKNNGNLKDMNVREMVKQAIDILDQQGFDFSDFDGNKDGWIDSICIIHQGEGEEAGGNPDSIWSHKWALESPIIKDGIAIQAYYTVPEVYYGQISTIGVICHEMGHFLGLPDLYDTDYSSAGIGVWGLMGYGAWNKGGRCPAHFCSWSKAYLGWIELETPQNNEGELYLGEIKETHKALILTTKNRFEYFLLEYRSQYGFDQGLPSSGLLIWHIDESRANNNQEGAYFIALEQADGRFDLEKNLNYGDQGDPWPGSSHSYTFDSYSKPSTLLNDGSVTDIGLYNISVQNEKVYFYYKSINSILKQSVIITNASNHTLTLYQIQKKEDSSWLEVNFYNPVTLKAQESVTVTLVAKTYGLDQENYHEVLQVITDQANVATPKIDVFLTIFSPQIEIKGQIFYENQPLEGVEIIGFPKKIKTNPLGFFSYKVPYGWSGHIRFFKQGFTFDPNEEDFEFVKTNIFLRISVSMQGSPINHDNPFSGGGAGGCSLSPSFQQDSFQSFLGYWIPFLFLFGVLMLRRKYSP